MRCRRCGWQRSGKSMANAIHCDCLTRTSYSPRSIQCLLRQINKMSISLKSFNMYFIQKYRAHSVYDRFIFPVAWQFLLLFAHPFCVDVLIVVFFMPDCSNNSSNNKKTRILQKGDNECVAHGALLRSTQTTCFCCVSFFRFLATLDHYVLTDWLS